MITRMREIYIEREIKRDRKISKETERWENDGEEAREMK